MAKIGDIVLLKTADGEIPAIVTSVEGEELITLTGFAKLHSVYATTTDWRPLPTDETPSTSDAPAA